ncbi:MAG: SOS response-associated peptidase [Verrucomicrobia bacterium]|nr:SOS response-associated peptidase [Verrucomicrobiota bacterium]
MCGRYTQTKDGEYVEQYFDTEVTEGVVAPRYNVAPGQHAPVALHFEGRKLLALFRWGLVPSWAKDDAMGFKMINARAETLAEKPSFKRLLKRRRCLVAADGFYEWKKIEGTKTKTPYRFTLKSGDLFAFAGLWDSWRTPDGSDLYTYTIVTTEANEIVKPVHHRMPVVLSREKQEVWLDPGRTDEKDVLPFMEPCPNEDLRSCEVSTIVNSPRNDTPECIRTIGAGT